MWSLLDSGNRQRACSPKAASSPLRSTLPCSGDRQWQHLRRRSVVYLDSVLAKASASSPAPRVPIECSLGIEASHPVSGRLSLGSAGSGRRSTSGSSRLTPSGLGSDHQGQIFAGLVSDVDAVQNLDLRVFERAAVVAVVSAGCVVLTAGAASACRRGTRRRICHRRRHCAADGRLSMSASRWVWRRSSNRGDERLPRLRHCWR